MGNRNMHKAKRNKKDEFYTQIADIEREVLKYEKHFKDKVVYLNCDDPMYENIEGEMEVHEDGSHFWNFFYLQFERLGLKKLIATHYDDENPTYKLEYTGGGIDNVVKTPLEQNGDFRSPESIEILKESDIICTNPPFSLFREYVAQLIEYDKDFLIMGNNNAITYKEIFPLIKGGEMWLGHHANKTMEFRIPNHYEKWDRIDESGNKYGKVPAISWFTNLDFDKRHEEMFLYHDYYGNEDKYPKYDNYDAIEVSRVKDIPRDYEGVMGVPITFLNHYNPNQFKILGMSKTPICYENDKEALRIKEYTNVRQYRDGEDVGSGNKINDGVAIVVDDVPDKGTYYKSKDSQVIMIAKYARILIKNQNPKTKKGDE